MNDANLAQLQIELRRDEGFSRTIYTDSMGNPSIGIGHNLRAKPLPNGWKVPLNDIQIYTLLQNDVQDDALTPLDTHLPWWSAMSDVRQRAIANMCFNLGIGKLLEFHDTLASMQAGDYDAAADGMKNSAWYGEVGQRAVRLVAMMRDGVA